jgi:very-short-patch-repair endonuclease/predicted transcriptional regulator of viral defense system
VRQIRDRIGTSDRAPSHERVAKLAARQHGLVSRRQLLEAGLSSRSVKHRISAGWLHPIHAGVYAVGHTHLLPAARYMAAVLAVGDGAVLSHRAAAARLGLRPPPSGPIDVTVLRGGGRRHERIAVHVTRSLPESEITTVESIPCTTWARTLVDLAATMNERQLRRALERTLELRLFDGHAVDAVLKTSNGRRGTGLLRRILADLADEAPPTRQELERRFLELVTRARLPYPIVNGRIGELEVDFHWPEHRVVVETDGGATHGHVVAFHRDRDRDLTLALADWHVIRLTWRQVLYEPQRVVTALRRLVRTR